MVARACIRCGCVDSRACLEFDAEGFAHACYWVAVDLCSACAFLEHIEPPEADDGVETRLRLVHRQGKPYVRVPALAGMVARPRVQTPGKRSARRSTRR